MPKGILSKPPMCKSCGKLPAIKYYCQACGRRIKLQKKKESGRRRNPLGLLIIPGAKRAPSMTIIKDALPPEQGGFSPGIRFVGKHNIMCMLSSKAFADGTIVKAGGRILRIVNSRFEELRLENKSGA